MKKLLLTGIAVLFLATGTAQATENYFLQCGPRLVNVYGHHGFTYSEIIKGEPRELSSHTSHMFRAKGDSWYFYGRKCFRIPAMEQTHD